MDWLAVTHWVGLQRGARLNVIPSPWIDEQPPYQPAVGDKFDIDFINRHRLSGTVITAAKDQIEASFVDGSTYTIIRTPADIVAAQPSIRESNIPHDDWIVA
ncbi:MULTISPECIES: hypothetical protein [unclassified Sphingopyxis]|uniref:hypothetical protein n=1 Tax=unclassified Sphingopyxis TaxID=2614943 RepID=UPI0012E36E91|nr:MULTISPECIES: hypothetical protein [unclassified Sphingopyxis]